MLGNGFTPLGLFDPTNFVNPQADTQNNSHVKEGNVSLEKKNDNDTTRTEKIKTPNAIQVVDDPDAEYYVAVGLYDNFNGMSKANFISSADIKTESTDKLANYKLQDLFYGAYHFKNLTLAVEIIDKYYQYYNTNLQRYAVYGVKNSNVELIWYQDGFYSYIGKSQSEHGDNWFYGIVDFQRVKNDFSKENAPLLFRGRSLNDYMMPTIGGFPRESVVVQYDKVKNGEATVYLYYYKDPHAFDTVMSRLARLESQMLENVYDLEVIKKSIMKQNSLLERSTDVIALTNYAKNEKQVPAWLRSLARYGRND